MIGAGIVMGFGLMLSGLLMIFRVGPFWTKPIIILASMIVAVIVLACEKGQAAGRDSEKKEESKKEEPPKEEKPREEKREEKKEEPKKATDTKKSTEKSFGSMTSVVIILAIAAGIFFFFFRGESVHVNYTWTDENQGAVKIGTLDVGSYKVKVKSDFKYEEMKDGEIVMVVPIGPKGLVGRIVATQSQLPMPSAPFGARLVRVGNGPWQLLGEETTINSTEKADAYATINVRQIPGNFHNQGGDDITIKRSW